MSQVVKIKACADCSPVKYEGEITTVCSNPRVLVERYRKKELLPPGLSEVQSTVNLGNEINILDKTKSKGKKGTKRTRKEAVPKKSSKAKLSLKKNISSKDLNEALLNPLKDLNETDDFATVPDKPPTKKKRSDNTKSAEGTKKPDEEKIDHQIDVPEQDENVETDEKYGVPQLNSGEEDITEEAEADLSSDESNGDYKTCVICNQRMEKNELLSDHFKKCLNQHFNRERKKHGATAESVKEEADIPVELILCQTCHVDLSELTPYRQTIHVNSCMDKNRVKLETTTDTVGKVDDVILPCPICGKPLKTKTLRTSHIKKCSSLYGVPDYMLDNLLTKEKKQLEKQITDGSVSSGLTEHKTGNVPLQNNRNIRGKGGKGQVKKSKKSTDIVDEDTEFAMALSTSMIEEQQNQKKILMERLQTIDRQAVGCKKSDKDIRKGRKKKAGFSSSPDKLPALLQQTTEEIRQRIADRVGEIITLMDDIPIENTPPLESSSLGNKFLQSASNSKKSICEEGPSLWRKSSMKMGPADIYYVEQLANHVSVLNSKQGTSLSRHASITARRRSSEHEKSMTQTGTSSVEEESMDIVSTQTAIVLAELASDYNTSYVQSGDFSQCSQDQTSSFTSKNKSSIQAVTKKEQTNDPAIDAKFDTSEDLSCSGFCSEERDQEEEISAHISSLHSDLCSMVNNPVFSDVKIRTAEGRWINGHKMILAARCPCLTQALQLDIELDLEKFSHSVVLSVLKFIYSGEIPQIVDTECHHLAKRLGLTELSDIYDKKQETERQIGNNSEKAGDGNIENLITSFFSGCSDSETEYDNQIVDQKEEEEMDSLYQFMSTKREKSSNNKGDNLPGKSTEPLDSCDKSSDSNNVTPIKTKEGDEEIQTKNSCDSKSNSVSDSESSQQSPDDFKTNVNERSEIELSDNDLQPSSYDTRSGRKKRNKSSKMSKKRKTVSSSDTEFKSFADVSPNKRRKTYIDDAKINKTPEAVRVYISKKTTSSASSYTENTENQFEEVHSMLNELSPDGVHLTKLEWPNLSPDGSRTPVSYSLSSSKDNSPGRLVIQEDTRSEDSTELSEGEIEPLETSDNINETQPSVRLLDKATGTLLCRSGGKTLIVTPQFKLSLLKRKTNLPQSEEKQSEMNRVKQKQTESTEGKNTSSSSSGSQSNVQNDASVNTSDSWLIPDTPAKTPSFTTAKSFSVVDRTRSAQQKSLKKSDKQICKEESMNTGLLDTCPETSTDTHCTPTESIDFRNLSKCQPSFSNAVVSTPISDQSRRNLFSNQKYLKSLNSASDNDNCLLIEDISPERNQNLNESLDLIMVETKELPEQTKLQTSESNSSDQDSEIEILNDNFEESVSPKFPSRISMRQSQSKSDSPSSHGNPKDLTEGQNEDLLMDVDDFFGRSPSASRVNISNRLRRSTLASPDTDLDRQSKSSNSEADELPDISSPQLSNSLPSSQTSVIIEADIHHSACKDYKQVRESPVREKRKAARKFTFKKLGNKPSHAGTCIQQNDEITLMSSEISFTKSLRSSCKKTKSPAQYSPPIIMDLSDPEPSCTSPSDDNAPVLINLSDEKLPESNSAKDDAEEGSDPETVELEDVWADFDDAGVEFNPGLGNIDDAGVEFNPGLGNIDDAGVEFNPGLGNIDDAGVEFNPGHGNSPEQIAIIQDSSDTEVEALEVRGECTDHVGSLETPSEKLNSPPHPATPPHEATVTPQGTPRTRSATTPAEFDSPLAEVDYLEQFEHLDESFQCPQETMQVDDPCNEITKQPVEITKTPKCPKQTKPKKKWVPPSPFTPMLGYDQMNTPGLKKEMHKYGIKAVSKKRMIVCLKDIYHQTHQYETDSEAEITIIEDDDRSKTAIETKKNQPKCILDHGNINNQGKKPQVLKKSAPSLLQKLQSKSVSNKKTAESCNGGDLVDLSAENDESDDDDDDGDSSQSDVLEESFMIGTEDIPFSQQESNPNLQQELHKFFTTDPSLYCRVLMYEPLELDWLKDEVKNAGIKCSADKLLKYLDEKCIMFTMKSTTNRQRGRRKKGKKTATKQ